MGSSDGQQYTDSLGTIISQVFRDRDSHWVLVAPASSAPSRPERTDRPQRPEQRSKMPAARESARVLRDGTQLCSAWQTGKCSQQKENRCKNGLRRCAVEFSSGRVCVAALSISLLSARMPGRASDRRCILLFARVILGEAQFLQCFRLSCVRVWALCTVPLFQIWLKIGKGVERVWCDR